MLFVIAMMIEDTGTGAMTLVQDTFVGVTEDEALGKAFKLFKDYGSVHSYKINFVSNDVSEKETQTHSKTLGYHPSYELENVDSEIVDFLHRGQKIQAIKRHRQLTGYGLKQSKEFINNLISKHDNLLRF